MKKSEFSNCNTMNEVNNSNIFKSFMLSMVKINGIFWNRI